MFVLVNLAWLNLPSGLNKSSSMSFSIFSPDWSRRKTEYSSSVSGITDNDLSSITRLLGTCLTESGDEAVPSFVVKPSESLSYALAVKS